MCFFFIENLNQEYLNQHISELKKLYHPVLKQNLKKKRLKKNSFYMPQTTSLLQTTNILYDLNHL